MATKNIKVYQDLMGENAKWAAKTRQLCVEKKIRLLNLIGSPGSGKTALLEAAIKAAPKLRLAVLEGDVETTNDAVRIARLGIIASQLLTGGACHLEAKLVHYALRDLPLAKLDLVVVENVGNLVCPAEFDIGELAKVAVLSVTEGEDKPLKYPLLFREAKAVVITKTDLLPHLQFNLKLCLENVRKINAQAPIFQVAATTGKGLEEWVAWMRGK